MQGILSVRKTFLIIVYKTGHRGRSFRNSCSVMGLRCYVTGSSRVWPSRIPHDPAGPT